MENGYHLYDFKGELLREEHVDKFKQLLWRPRPLTLLSKEEQKQIRKNLREYGRVFDEEDSRRKNIANVEVIEARRAVLSEWLAWREREQEELRADRAEAGLAEDLEEELAPGKAADGEENAVVEEIVEEVMEETEEIVS